MKDAISEVGKSLAFVVSGSPGTGLFLAPDLVLTCSHVVSEKIEVATADGRRELASVSRRSSSLDLAVARTSSPMGSPARLSRRNKGVGTDVVFLGFPFPGVFNPPLAVAIRTMIGNRYLEGGVEYYVIGAMTAEGYSGSPLFLESGEVVGVVTSRLDPLRIRATRKRGAPVSNISFALTSREIVNWLEEP